MNNNNYYQNHQSSDGVLIQKNPHSKYQNGNNTKSQNVDRFKNIGNLIISQNDNNNRINNYRSNTDENEDNNDLVHYKDNDGYKKNNRYITYNSLKNSSNHNSNNKFIFFDKEEYNKLYNSGKGLSDQVNQNLQLNEINNNFMDDKNNYQLSTIKNENVNSNNTELMAEEEKKNYIGKILEDSLNLINNSQNNEFLSNKKGNNENELNNNEDKRPFSPPITKIEDNEIHGF